VILDHTGAWACKVPQAEMELLEQMVAMVVMEPPVLLDLEENLDQWVPPVMVEEDAILPTVMGVKMVAMEKTEKMDAKVIEDQLDRQVQEDQQEPLDLAFPVLLLT